jgi:hypothetical protein
VSEDERFEAWLEKVCQRPIPNDAMARIRTLAKELAEGAVCELWDSKFYSHANEIEDVGGYFPKHLHDYLQNRWNNNYPSIRLLLHNGYFAEPYDDNWVLIGKSAFDLIQTVEPTSIFISYRRKDSSAFALLILKELKTAGLEAFLDLSLEPGEDWHAGLKERIQSYDYFILVLGKETLNSEVVRDEITWAMEAGLTIIPVWHGGFEYQSADWNDIPEKINRLLANSHSIRVREESALDYNTAIVELLNRFGVTP